jgi:hypothetical protein
MYSPAEAATAPVLEVGVQTTLAKVGMLAPALLAAAWRTAVVKRFLAAAME